MLLDTDNVKTLPIAGQCLQGVYVKPLVKHDDERGAFTEAFQQKWPTSLTPAQWSYVESEATVLRGMHLHQRHDELFCLIKGHCLVGLYDLRPGSPTQFQSSLYEFHGQEPTTLVFPPGLLHGWYFITPSIHLQAVSESFETYGDDDNYGCHWNDPKLNLSWGVTDPIVSGRAESFPSLTTLITSLTAVGWLATPDPAIH